MGLRTRPVEGELDYPTVSGAAVGRCLLEGTVVLMNEVCGLRLSSWESSQQMCDLTLSVGIFSLQRYWKSVCFEVVLQSNDTGEVSDLTLSVISQQR